MRLPGLRGKGEQEETGPVSCRAGRGKGGDADMTAARPAATGGIGSGRKAAAYFSVISALDIGPDKVR